MSDSKKCVFIVNLMSGRGDRADPTALETALGKGFECDFIYIKEKTTLDDLSSYDRIVACGGDGTLNGVLNCRISSSAEVFYVPCGTLNETADYLKKRSRDNLTKVGKIGKTYFSYVCAAGSFTPLGYKVEPASKKRLGAFAYFKQVVPEYKIWEIHAKVNADGRVIEGPFTLLMTINSSTCFKFRFNKLFDPQSETMHLLLIKTPKHRGLLGKIEMFFPFFRAFFIGFSKPYFKKKMMFLPVRDFEIVLKDKTPFDMDGELFVLDQKLNVQCVPPPFMIKTYLL